ncbi:hypothetical protein ACFL3C_04645 [Patescibacteria group bacterium]
MSFDKRDRANRREMPMTLVVSGIAFVLAVVFFILGTRKFNEETERYPPAESKMNMFSGIEGMARWGMGDKIWPIILQLILGAAFLIAAIVALIIHFY